MKIGIITFQRSYQSYGAELQNLALHKYIEGLGFECETIDLLRPCHKLYKQSENKLKNNIELSYKIDLRKTLFLLKKNGYQLFKSILTTNKKKKANFDTFISQINLSTNYKNYSELRKSKLDYDYVIAGSDQIWNPLFEYDLAPYFLDFILDNSKKIAYAPSFGISELPPKYNSAFSKWIASIAHLSVRESEGAQIIQKLTGLKAPIVLDPTFLLTEKQWIPYINLPKTKNTFILCFTLNDSPELVALTLHIQKLTGHKVIRISNNLHKMAFKFNVNTINTAGPQDLLGLIKKASVVITDSFHGTALSINFNKDFFSVVSQKKNGSLNSRLESILRILKLENRIYHKNIGLPTNDNLYIDYTKANIILDNERKNSKEFLNIAINKIQS